MLRKLKAFLKDETASAALEYGLFAAGLAVVVVTAVKPVSLVPACPTCGIPMRFVTAIAEFGRHPELRIYVCKQCEKTAIEEWEPGKSVGGSRWGDAATATAIECGLRITRIVVVTIVVAKEMGNKLHTTFSSISTQLK
jgi:Flp pilus assembly pilin Flp